MKILVFSDSHGSAYKMEEAVRAENPDFVFFLGDGEGDLHVLTNAFPQLPVQAVRGNCDLYSSLPAERLCVLGGFRFREIASFTGEPLSTVLSRYRRAMKKLRVLLS